MKLSDSAQSHVGVCSLMLCLKMMSFSPFVVVVSVCTPAGEDKIQRIHVLQWVTILTMMQDVKFIHCQVKTINKHYILLEKIRDQCHSVIYLSCILSQIILLFVYDLFRPVLAGAQVYSRSSPACRFYKHGWRWLPAQGLRDLDGWWQNWRVSRCRVGPAGTGPSTGVSRSWLEDKVRADNC